MGSLRQRAIFTVLWAATVLHAQAPRRTQLIMKDGTHQWVLRYEIKGDLVRYTSAERNGELDDVPLALVDIPATQQWARDHASLKADTQRAVLSPGLARQEALRAARTPEVTPGLKLPEELSLLALDQINGQPELLPLQQKGSGLNAETGHDVTKQVINPSSLAHDIYDLRGNAADVVLHTFTPTFYVRIGNDDDPDGGGGSALVVDTHGGSGRATPDGGGAKSTYVVEKLRTRSDSREVDSFRIGWLGQRKQPDLIELDAQLLPGNRWMKLTPNQSLERGQYALVEILSRDTVNLAVWDFGVEPDAPGSLEAIHPETQKPIELERRRPE